MFQLKSFCVTSTCLFFEKNSRTPPTLPFIGATAASSSRSEEPVDSGVLWGRLFKKTPYHAYASIFVRIVYNSLGMDGTV